MPNTSSGSEHLITTCEHCGGTATLDHLVPRLNGTIDTYVYRCTICGRATSLDLPRRLDPER